MIEENCFVGFLDNGRESPDLDFRINNQRQFITVINNVMMKAQDQLRQRGKLFSKKIRISLFFVYFFKLIFCLILLSFFFLFFFFFLVAWALHNIVVLSRADVSGESDRPEAFLRYYDVLVRNAFGNYYDVLREVSAEPLMAQYLSFRDSQSYLRSRQFPDENYAREIMQLFSIGLNKLNDDGSNVLDENGEAIPTYDQVSLFVTII